MSNTNGDYISREYLLNEYDKRHEGPPGGARKLIEKAPPADVRPMVRGKFELVKEFADGSAWKCSNCNLYYTGNTLPEINFCPNCGADMRPEGGAENGENLH